jgi:dihydropteroate synthase
MRPLLEPQALLDGAAARDAIAAGLALPLGPCRAFALARLIGDPGDPLVPVAALPPAWRALAATLSGPPAVWAGLSGFPAVMGVLNITPDSFSDGGLHLDPGRADAAGREMIAAGAAIIDIGGESTRPGAAPVTPEEEQARILPVIRRLRDAGAAISVDTRNAATMQAALDAGAGIVNDISGLTHDPAAASLLARRDCAVLLMHMRGTPATMAGVRGYRDVAVEVTRELADSLDAAMAAGIDPVRIALDPGIGFAKGAAENLEILGRLPLLLNLGRPILVGVSRKAFTGSLSGASTIPQRASASLAAGLRALGGGAAILRAHDVAATVRGVRMWQAMQAWDKSGSDRVGVGA